VVHPIIDNKEFCSKECLKTEVKNVSTPCSVCKRIIIRPDGLKKAGTWFCKLECWDKSDTKTQYDKELEFLVDQVNQTKDDISFSHNQCNETISEEDPMFDANGLGGILEKEGTGGKKWSQPQIEELEDLGFGEASCLFDRGFGEDGGSGFDVQKYNEVINQQLDTQPELRKCCSEDFDVNLESMVFQNRD
jgi:hypothetical protein